MTVHSDIIQIYKQKDKAYGLGIKLPYLFSVFVLKPRKLAANKLVINPNGLYLEFKLSH